MLRNSCMFAMSVFVVTSAVVAQESRPSNWGQDTAEKLSHFLPNQTSGLVPQTPWGGPNDNHVDLSVGFEASVSTRSNEYVIARALQKWWFDAPELFQQVASAESDQKKSEQAGLENVKAHQDEIKALQKQAQELAEKGEMKEMQAVMDKIKAYMPDDSKEQQMDGRIRNLRGSARSLEVYIEANATAANTLDASAKQVGAVQGHPFYHVVWPGPVQPMSWINLAVFVGPNGFRNPNRGGSKGILKCVLVWMRVTTRPDKAGFDEAFARKVLESINYEGLSKLLAN